MCELERNSTAKLGVVPLCHLQVRFPMILPNAFLRPEVHNPDFRAIPRQTTSGLGMQNRVFGESVLQAPQAPALDLFFVFLAQAFRGGVATLGLQMHVMLHPTKDKLELLQRDASRGHAHQSLFDVRHLVIFV